MNPVDPLAGLHPLREPPPVPWWPPAPGWWILAGLAALLLAAAVWWLWRRHRREGYRRAALRRLDQLLELYAGHGDSRRLAGEVNALLKAVALRAFPAREVAAASGADWRRFLQASVPDAEALELTFVETLYRPEPDRIDQARLRDEAARWIRRHRRPR